MKTTNYSTMTTRKNIAQRIDSWTHNEPRFTEHRVDGDIEYVVLTAEELDWLKEKVFSNLNKGLRENLEVWTNKATGYTYFRTYAKMYSVAIKVISQEDKDAIVEANKQKKADAKQALLDKLNVKNELAEIPTPDERVSKEAVSKFFIALCKKYGDMFMVQEDYNRGYAGIDTMSAGWGDNPECFVRIDIRSSYDWEALKDTVDYDNEVSVSVEKDVYVEIGTRCMMTTSVEQMNLAADQCRAAAQIAERFNERMNGVLVVY